jgi:hypothetical protein
MGKVVMGGMTLISFLGGSHTLHMDKKPRKILKADSGGFVMTDDGWRSSGGVTERLLDLRYPLGLGNVPLLRYKLTSGRACLYYT